MSKTYRTTISIPRDLKEEMDALGDQVNWSAVAAAAFRAKVFEVQNRRRESMSKEDVIKRMRTADENDTEDFDGGKQAGREWAERDASPKELRRLVRYMKGFDSYPGVSWWDVDANWSGPGGAADRFVWAAWPSRKEDRTASGEFWESALGEDNVDRVEDSDFLRGFGEGAAEVWDEVKDEL
jgi:hypothetical protein